MQAITIVLQASGKLPTLGLLVSMTLEDSKIKIYKCSGEGKQCDNAELRPKYTDDDLYYAAEEASVHRISNWFWLFSAALLTNILYPAALVLTTPITIQ